MARGGYSFRTALSVVHLYRFEILVEKRSGTTDTTDTSSSKRETEKSSHRKLHLSRLVGLEMGRFMAIRGVFLGALER